MNADTLKNLLADHQLYHSELQMDAFIVRAAGGTTPYGQYKQALRELHKRWRGVKQLQTEKELLEIDIAELQAPPRRNEEFFLSRRNEEFFLSRRDGIDYQRRRDAVKVVQKRMALEDLERSMADTQREFEHFYETAERLKKIVGELTPARRAQLDREMWQATIREKAAMEIAFRGSISMETACLVMSLPKDERLPLLTEFKSKHAQEAMVRDLERFDDNPSAPAQALHSDASGCAPSGMAPSMALPC